MPLFRNIFLVCIAVVLAQAIIVSQVFAESYSYDNTGRLTSVTYDDGTTLTYTYDEVGNITSTVASIDTDGDGILDGVDNCTLVPNPAQRDTNGDGYGNFCDPDLDNSGTVNFLDLGIMKSLFFTADLDADLDGDSAVNFLDLGILKAMMFQPPGPRGSLP